MQNEGTGGRFKNVEIADSRKKVSVRISWHEKYIYMYIIFFRILDTTNMVKTVIISTSIEIYFSKPLKMSKPGDGRKLGNKNRLKQS